MKSETVERVPLQHVKIVKCSHDNTGARIPEFALLAGGANWDSGPLQADGNADFEYYSHSDVAGIMYVFVSANPNSAVMQNAPGAALYAMAWATLACAAGAHISGRLPVRTKYYRVIYLNGAAAQADWDFSWQLTPIGGNVANAAAVINVMGQDLLVTTNSNNGNVVDGAVTAWSTLIFGQLAPFPAYHKFSISGSIATTGIGNIEIEYSIDGVTWRDYEDIPIQAGQKVDKVFEITRPYYRVRYADTADGVATAGLDLTIIQFPIT